MRRRSTRSAPGSNRTSSRTLNVTWSRDARRSFEDALVKLSSIIHIKATKDARISRGIPRSLVPPKASPFEAVPGPKTDVGRLASGAEKVRSAHHHHAHVTGGPRATRRAGSVGRTAGTCPDAPPRRGHPRDHNRVPRHVVVRSETAYGRQLLEERFRPPAVAVGRPSTEARAWRACASPRHHIARPELRQGPV